MTIPAALPPDLIALRSHLGEALFEARLAEARAREAKFLEVQSRVEAGQSLRSVLAEFFGTAKRQQRNFYKWREGGVFALVSRSIGPRKFATLAPRVPERAEKKQLLLPFPERVPKSRAGRLRRGILRIPGTKARLVDRLAARCPPHFERYFEPFIGGGALFIHLAPAQSVLSDLNAEFINLYTVLRDQPSALLQALARYENSEAHYYQARSQHPDQLAPIDRAARTYFLNQTCFNGIFRVNASGLFNVPYGHRAHSDWIRAPFLEHVSRLLQTVELRSGDFEEGLRGCRKGDFVYLDPPYDLRPGEKELKYQRGAFGPAEQERLAETVRRLDQSGVRFLLSNADTPRIRKLYRGFVIETLEVSRVVGGNAGRRGTAAEVLVRNYEQKSH